MDEVMYNINNNYSSNDDYFSFIGIKLENFKNIKKFDDFHAAECMVSFKETLYDFLNKFRKKVESLGLTLTIDAICATNYHLYVNHPQDGQVLLINVWPRREHLLNKETADEITFSFFGRYEEIAILVKYLENGKVKTPTLKWVYLRSDGGIGEHNVELEQEHEPKDEFYPWLQNGIEAYYNEYFNSSSSILILLGEPGTGKTSFIRNMIMKKNLNAMFTYDEQLMTRDKIFIDFMTSKDMDALVIEDADTLIVPRETHGNPIMSKMLNISDGLLKKSKKKLIFTANIGYENRNSIDSALMRPGRCFDVVHFRPLIKDEAIKVASIIGANPPTKSEITLAELTTGLKTANEGKTTIGFIPKGRNFVYSTAPSEF